MQPELVLWLCEVEYASVIVRPSWPRRTSRLLKPTRLFPPCRRCDTPGVCERTIQFSRTEGTEGSGVGGDTLVSPVLSVKSFEEVSCVRLGYYLVLLEPVALLRFSYGAALSAAETFTERSVGPDGAGSYSQAFQSEGPDNAWVVSSLTSPSCAFVRRRWAADSSYGRRVVKLFFPLPVFFVSAVSLVVSPPALGFLVRGRRGDALQARARRCAVRGGEGVLLRERRGCRPANR